MSIDQPVPLNLGEVETIQHLIDSCKKQSPATRSNSYDKYYRKYGDQLREAEMEKQKREEQQEMYDQMLTDGTLTQEEHDVRVALSPLEEAKKKARIDLLGLKPAENQHGTPKSGGAKRKKRRRRTKKGRKSKKKKSKKRRTRKSYRRR